MRLVQGAAGSETSYGDPLEAALTWQRDGAEWIHLVDLDAAFGRGDNRALLADVVARLDVAVELSGGIRDDASLAAASPPGAPGSTSAPPRSSRPAGCGPSSPSTAQRIAVGLDVRGTTLAARGWTQEGGDLGDDGPAPRRRRLRPLRRHRRAPDGTLTGPNLDLPRLCARAPTGRSSPAAECPPRRPAGDRRAGPVEGAIVGKALYAGAFTLPQAMEAVKQA